MSISEFVDYIGNEHIEKIVRFRVKRNVDLYSAIESVIKEKNISNAIIIGNSGALKSAILRNVKKKPENYPVKPADRIYYSNETPMELISLNGWVAPTDNGEPYIHLHFGVSTVPNDSDKVIALGGHLEKNAAKTWLGVVISIIVFSNDSGVQACEDNVTKMYDLFY